MAFAHDIRAAETGIAHRAASALRAIARRYRQYRLEQRTYRELMALSDRELDDLGLSRSMLHSVAHEAATHN